MEILINTDHNIEGTAQMRSYFQEQIENQFERFSEHLSRIEVKISDENGDKKSENDKRCVLEARIKGMQPIAVTSFGNTVEKAFNTAADKMKTSLDSTIGKLRSY